MNPVNQIEPVSPSPSEMGIVGVNPHAQLPGPVFAPVSGSLAPSVSPPVPVSGLTTTDSPPTALTPTLATASSTVDAPSPGSSDAEPAPSATAPEPASVSGDATAARIVDVGAGMTVLVTGSAPVAGSGAEIPVLLPTPHGQAGGVDAVEASVADDDVEMTTSTSLQLSIAASPEEPTPDAQQPPRPSASATPLLGALLRRPTEIRRDNTPVGAASRVVLPRPCAADIEAIDAMYADGGDWSSLVSSIEQARPYQLPRARYVMIIDTGRAFERMGINKIMASFLKENGNATVTEQIRLQQLGQISKGRRGELRVKVKTRAACEQLARQEVKILGGKYVFQDFDILADRFYIDISSVDSNFDNEGLLRAFYEIQCEPIYDTFRDVNLASGMTTATWRVYFRRPTCPEALLVQGHACDQVIYAGRMYPAQARDTPFPSQRRGFGQVSPHALNLDKRNEQTTPPATVPGTGGNQTSYADAVKNGTPPASPAPNGGGSNAGSVISVGTHVGSVLTPPGSPRRGQQTPPPPLALPAPAAHVVGSVEPKRKGKRSRYADDFDAMLQKGRSKPVEGIATSNYFDVLSQVEFEIDCINASVSEASLPRFQIVPRKVKCAEKVKTSKESSHFLVKNHTSVTKTKEATSFQEVVAELEITEATADLHLQPNHLAAADARADGLLKTLRSTSNPDTVGHTAGVNAPLAFNSVLLGEMADLSENVGELAQLHMLNRILSATDPNSCTTFAHKWAKYFGEKLPKSRDEVFRRTAKWWRDPKMAVLLRATRALSLFELMLMCTAPHLYKNDMWIQRLTGHPVGWIPALNGRLLHPNVLLSLLRSELGAQIFRVWEKTQWQGELLEDLEYLQGCGLFFADDEAVLQLTSVDGVSTLGAGPLCLDC